jgi:hypothetical protein
VINRPTLRKTFIVDQAGVRRQVVELAEPAAAVTPAKSATPSPEPVQVSHERDELSESEESAGPA